MDGERQNNQLELAFGAEGRGEAPTAAREGTEPSMASREPEDPVASMELMEEVLEEKNLRSALKRVQANRGAAGVDGMSVEQLPLHLREHWPAIRQQLLEGTYRPQPVRRVQIPKPDGRMRKLGIPTVLDRMIQQAVLQVLQEPWDGTFSEHSFGFRPGRSAHQAVAEAQQHIAEGHRWVVDIDLEKFFDRVNHDRLMAQVAQRVKDKRVLKLIRAYLNAGVMDNGLEEPTVEGTPQGGPLSPLLSNIDAPQPQHQHRAARGAAASVSARVARLLRLRPDAIGVRAPGLVDPEAAPCRHLEAGTSRHDAVRDVPPHGAIRRDGRGGGGVGPKCVAQQPQPWPERRPAQRLLHFPRVAQPGSTSLTQPTEPPCTDPYARWCDRDSGRPPTYVDRCTRHGAKRRDLRRVVAKRKRAGE